MDSPLPPPRIINRGSTLEHIQYWGETLRLESTLSLESVEDDHNLYPLLLSDGHMIRDDDSSAMILSLDIQVSNNATLTPDQRESLLRLLKTKACEIETILAMHPASTKIITQARSTGVGLVSVDHRAA